MHVIAYDCVPHQKTLLEQMRVALSKKEERCAELAEQASAVFTALSAHKERSRAELERLKAEHAEELTKHPKESADAREALTKHQTDAREAMEAASAEARELATELEHARDEVAMTTDDL